MLDQVPPCYMYNIDIFVYLIYLYIWYICIFDIFDIFVYLIYLYNWYIVYKVYVYIVLGSIFKIQNEFVVIGDVFCLTNF